MAADLQLDALDYRVTDDAVEVHLGRVTEGEPDADHALVRLRVVTEPAPCWGHEQHVELLDIEVSVEAVENWKPIPGYPRYEASSIGRVRTSFDRLGRQLAEPRILAQSKTKKGYLRVALTNADGERHHFVQRLVLTAFVGPRNPGQEACHNNGDRSDNRAENLRWDTRKNNHADKAKHGTDQIGSRHPRSLLTEFEVAAIATHKGWLTGTHLAEVYGVTPDCISRIQTGRAWKHVTANVEAWVARETETVLALWNGKRGRSSWLLN